MSSTISRRSLARGAAWSVPAITVLASAPAVAASPVPSVKGQTYYFDDYYDGITGKTITGEVRSANPASCSYTVTDGPASVTNLSATYWLPVPNYTFTKVGSSPWSNLTRDTTQANKVGSTTHLTYYAYTTTYSGTGSSTTTCGPSYSFTAPKVTTTITNPNASYYFQLSYNLNGVRTTNQLREINNP